MHNNLSLKTELDSRKHILLVEDNKANILVATTLLEEFGYSFETVTNGLAALDKIRENKFDAVLMDVQMHGIDGFETTRQIRALEKDGEHVYVIAMTARALSGDREKCLAAGMDDYISKPFNTKEFRKKLDNLFAEKLVLAD